MMLVQSNLENVLNSYYDFDQMQKYKLMVNKTGIVERVYVVILFPKLRDTLFHYECRYISLKVLLTFSVILKKPTSAYCAICPNV